MKVTVWLAMRVCTLPRRDPLLARTAMRARLRPVAALLAPFAMQGDIQIPQARRRALLALLAVTRVRRDLAAVLRAMLGLIKRISARNPVFFAKEANTLSPLLPASTVSQTA